MKRKNKGITLVALVITIIILLILAGITINLTVGTRGILTRAQEAGKNYQEAAKREDEELAKLWDEAENILKGTGSSNSEATGGSAGDGGQDPVNPGGDDKPIIPPFGTVTKTEDNVKYIADGEGNTIPVPEGFEPIKTEEQGTKDTGFVVVDENKNEFVWIPVNDISEYTRIAFLESEPGTRIDSLTNSLMIEWPKASNFYFTEALPEDEKNSIEKYKGYYIGRYEAGIVGYNASITTKNVNKLKEWTGYTNGTLVVQKGKQVWNYITRNQAQIEAERLYPKANENKVISKLCSGYAWDTALNFIAKKYPNYPKEGRLNQSSNKTTGQWQPANNIYDMGENVYEWCTESCNYRDASSVLRGGYMSRGTKV